MTIQCHSCSAEVPSDNVNIERMVAKCDACHAVFAFQVEGEGASRQRDKIARPEKWAVESFGSELALSRTWRHGCALPFLVVFTLLWNAGVWFMVTMLVAAQQWPFLAFLSIFVLAGLGIGYLTLCVALNTTTIRVDGRRLTVRHSPLPFFGQIDLDATKIAQLYVQQAITRSSSDNSMSTNVSYALHARMEDGSRKTIARSLPDSDEGLFLEQEIEDHLGVVDRPVRGEY